MSGAQLTHLSAHHGLLEAARWYPGVGLVFSDMTNGGVLQLAPDATEPTVLIPHRKGIGGLVAHAAGGYVLAGRNVAHKPDPAPAGRNVAHKPDPAPAGNATGCAGRAKTAVNATSARPVAPDGGAAPTPPGQVLLETGHDEQFFNDLTADGRGRLYVGSVGTDPAPGSAAARPDGRLYRIDLDGAVTVLSDDVTVSNGLGADPADERLYHVDTHRRLLWVFDIADRSSPGGPSSVRRPATGGEPDAGRELFVDTSEYAGVPDGLTVAADGSVWVALAGGGVVVAWDAKGQRVTEIPVPQALVTSVTFGGPDLRTLFILTGHDHEHRDSEGGCLYSIAAPVAGLPAPVCAVPT